MLYKKRTEHAGGKTFVIYKPVSYRLSVVLVLLLSFATLGYVMTIPDQSFIFLLLASLIIIFSLFVFFPLAKKVYSARDNGKEVRFTGNYLKGEIWIEQ